MCLNLKQLYKQKHNNSKQEQSEKYFHRINVFNHDGNQNWIIGISRWKKKFFFKKKYFSIKPELSQDKKYTSTLTLVETHSSLHLNVNVRWKKR